MTPATARPVLNGRPIPTHPTAAKPLTSTPARPAGKPWSIREFAGFLGCSERHVGTCAADGRIRIIRVGARVFIPDDEAQRIFREGTG
jgi:hypothetical protein